MCVLPAGCDETELKVEYHHLNINPAAKKKEEELLPLHSQMETG